jgi:hypothetical protein
MVNLIGETGKQNADRFIKVLKKLAVDNRHIVMYSDRTKGMDPDCVGWDWMHNAQWRSYVLGILMHDHSDLLVHPIWCSPDSAGGWSLAVVSRHASNRTAIMELDEKLRPGPLDGKMDIKKWSVSPQLVGAALVAVIVVIIVVLW